MNMTTRSQTRLGTGVRLVDPVASGDAVRVPASSSVQSRGASAGPDLVDSYQDGESFFVDRGRGGPTGRAHRDHGGRPAHSLFVGVLTTLFLNKATLNLKTRTRPWTRPKRSRASSRG